MQAPSIDYRFTGFAPKSDAELLLTRIIYRFVSKLSKNAIVLAHELKPTATSISLNKKHFSIAAQMLLGESLSAYAIKYKKKPSKDLNQFVLNVVKDTISDTIKTVKLIRGVDINIFVSMLASYLVEEIFFIYSSTKSKKTVTASDLASAIVSDTDLNQVISGTGLHAIKYLSSKAQIVRAASAL